MKLSIKSWTISLLLAFTVAFTGCGSSDKKVDDGENSEMSTESDSGLNLELNGDSDSSNAGGISTVFFDFNSSSLGGGTKSTLDANAEFLKSNAAVTIQVEGHCDERGGVQYNLALGEKRAAAVKRYLVAMGIDSSRISTISFGKERPVSFGHDDASWSQNRRANFVITAK